MYNECSHCCRLTAAAFLSFLSGFQLISVAEQNKSKSVHRFFSLKRWQFKNNKIFKWKCGGSLVALQTTEAVVPGSNPSSLTVENSEDRQSHCVYCKISGWRGRPPPGAQKREKKKFLDINLALCFGQQ